MDYGRNYVQNLLNGFMGTAVIYTACELGIFDLIKDEPKSTAEIAYILDVKEDEIKRLIRPLRQYMLLAETDGKIRIEEVGKILSAGEDNSLKEYALFCGRESVRAWHLLYPAIKAKTTPQKFINELEIFDEMEQDEGRFATFDGMMSSVSKNIDLESFFDEFRSNTDSFKIVDVGGGTGTIICKFLNHYKNANGVILDLSQAEKAAVENIEKNRLADRLKFKEASFFDELNVNADVYVLSRILHDWKDVECHAILENIAKEMDEDSRLIVIEDIIKEPTEQNALKGYMCDIQMWVFCNGRERTMEEFEDMFSKSGLVLEMISELPDGTFALIVKKIYEELIF